MAVYGVDSALLGLDANFNKRPMSMEIIMSYQFQILSGTMSASKDGR
jgi:hypothetical protein